MADQARLARLARVREVERRRAGVEAAASGGAHDQARALSIRSRELARSYGTRAHAEDGASLAALLGFREQLDLLSTRTSSDAETARLLAERARCALAVAEKRRDLVAERLTHERRSAEQRIEVRDLAQDMNSGRATRALSSRKAT